MFLKEYADTGQRTAPKKSSIWRTKVPWIAVLEGWRTEQRAWLFAYAVLGTGLVVLVGLYWATAVSMARLWTRGPFTHGIVVVPTALYLAWERRARIESGDLQPTPWALPVLALLAFLWLLGNLTHTGVVQHLCLVGMSMAFVWAVFGTSAARVLLLPMGFLLFAVPFGEPLIPVLQNLTARVAVRLLAATGVPVLLEGHVISIPGSTWQVAQACSGISYLTSSTAIGFLYAGIRYRRWPYRVAFFTASAFVPLLANGARVSTVILLASIGAHGVASGIEHYLYGWLFFMMVLGLLFWSCGRWNEGETQPDSRTSTPPRGTARAFPRSRVAAVATAGLLLVSAAPVAANLLSRPPSPTSPLRTWPPEVSPPWSSVQSQAYAWSPQFVSPSADGIRTYRSGDRTVMLYAARYRADEPGVKLASVGNRLFDDSWQPVGSGHARANIGGHLVDVTQTTIESAQSALVVWSWYSVGAVSTGNDLMAKLLLARSRLLRRSDDSAAFVVATESAPGTNAAGTLRDFLAHLSVE